MHSWLFCLFNLLPFSTASSTTAGTVSVHLCIAVLQNSVTPMNEATGMFAAKANENIKSTLHRPRISRNKEVNATQKLGMMSSA